MIVLGIDPGITNMGLGVVEQTGKIHKLLHTRLVKTTHGDPAPVRVGEIFQNLRMVIAEYRPQAIAVEEQFFYRQNELSYKVGWAMGAVLVAANERGLEVFGYGPMKVKGALVGYGHAEKEQVAFMVRAILGLKENPKPTHVADALAIALTHLFYAGRGGGTRL